MQLGQHHGVPAIRLHPITSSHRDQRQRDDRALVPLLGEDAMAPVPARPCLIAQAQVPTILGEPVGALGEHGRAVLDHPEAAHLTSPTTLGDRDRDGRLVHLQANEGDAIHQARPHA
jgi:hypothetical protein